MEEESEQTSNNKKTKTQNTRLKKKKEKKRESIPNAARNSTSASAGDCVYVRQRKDKRLRRAQGVNRTQQE